MLRYFHGAGVRDRCEPGTCVYDGAQGKGYEVNELLEVALRRALAMAERLKEIPHNMGGSLTGDFQPSAACKTLDYPPGNLRFLQATAD